MGTEEVTGGPASEVWLEQLRQRFTEIAARRVGYTPNDYAAYLLERSLRTAMRTAAEEGRVR